ncbi:hypothetical protein QQ045_016112 [Rhodiola kirilowii]
MLDMANATVAEVTGKIMVVAIIILFLVLILMSFLHLYAKWFRWRTEEEEDATNYPQAREAGRRRRFVFTTGQETVKRGLKPSVLRSLPVLVVDFNDGLECAVCLCEMVEGDEARMLPKCNHGFHVDCIDMWFESNSTCPLCRNLVVMGHESGAQMSSALEDGVQNVVDVELNVLTLSYPTNVLFWGNEVEVNIGGEDGSNVAPASSLASSSSQKSPLPMRLRTLKRLLSRDKRVLLSSSCSVDLEQGMSQS